ncbi:MAG: hypothetical protein ACRDEA_16975, partial [Microcystaceae cyanobacterium]
VLPGNAIQAALPRVREAEPPKGYSQSETGNEAKYRLIVETQSIVEWCQFQQKPFSNLVKM